MGDVRVLVDQTVQFAVGESLVVDVVTHFSGQFREE